MDSEIKRVRDAYARRAEQVDARLYSPFDSAYRLFQYSRKRTFVHALKRHGITSLQGKRVLDVGNGNAEILLENLEYGACSLDLYGVDILWDALWQGHANSPNLRLFCADGRLLPFRDESFDLVTLNTVFTSVLDEQWRMQIAAEALRVVNDSGIVIIFDFWPNNPHNPDVKGFRIRELKKVFPGCRYDIQHIILAPPIARRIAPLSPVICLLLEKLPFLRTHYMAGISPCPKAEK